MAFLTPESTTGILAAFGVAAVIILFAGVRLSSVADRLADRTGLGEAIVGAVLLGAATSLSGLTTSVVAAWNGLPELAVSNAAGGIAGQTFFLAIADLAYRRANLEHAAASLQNMIQGTVLTGCLALAVLGTAMPDYAVLGIHPASLLLVAFYALGLWVTRRASQTPGWQPERTDDTRTDDPDEDESGEASTARLWTEFALLALATGAAGLLVGRAAEGAVETYGLSQSVIGVFGTALVTSLPELVTTVAAVRRGALTLAVGGIIGGNAFDVLFLAASDAAYRGGPIYAAVNQRQVFTLALCMLMTTVLVMGLLRRERQGPGGIGFETVLLIAAYLVGGGVLVAAG
ncbi:sodium:calcium antiporter [Parvularcula dongshanensis]|uniref:Cation:H+ antiporter n=1 Tax=Parvularcula dongshanensis TaxID=1173995 RepID=A0A840HZE6_9PROT|nr:sodium:calcium antiporter [Parvularcula dongshanensis]MBB4657797.1 cation:H+ antiporter [Parvularcula dongshanensis]